MDWYRNMDMEIDDDRLVDGLQLENDMIELIFARLTALIDFIRFGAVCKTWRSIFLQNRHRIPQVPVLIIPSPSDDDKKNEFWSFFSLSEGKTYRLKKLPHENNEKWCCGSSEGCLIMVDIYLNISLFNPFSRTENLLPRLTTPPHIIDAHEPVTVDKVIIADPYVVAVLAFRSVLAFCKRDGDTWTYVESDQFSFEDVWFSFEDVVYYNGSFYAISNSGRVGVVDVSVPHPTLKMVAMIVDRGVRNCTRYLVVSSGQLLIVARIFNYMSWKTTGFKIFKVDVNKHMCFPLKALGDGMLFRGENCLMSLSAGDFSGCKRNHIYFTDNGCYDIRVCNVEDGSIKLYYKMDWRWLGQWPIWLTLKP